MSGSGYLFDNRTPRRTGIQKILRQRGAEPGFAHMLPTLFREIGLEQVGADGEVIDGGDTMRSLFRVNVEQAAEQLIQQQVVEPHELSAFIAQLDDGAVRPSSPLLISAWGRRPLDD